METKSSTGSGICYDAFISYRHTEPDMFAAQTLHREMEAFRLPRNLRKKQGEGKRTKIERVFRDRDELPLAANLADPITEALAVSDFLIVICSPRLPQSLWCRKEIQTFLEMHGREHILAVLVEGEPEEAFPEELLYREELVTKEDGTVVSVKTPVEPLAADVRGSSKREIKKKIKEEILRLAAPMFSCGYDELKQRHREQRLRRMIGAAAVIAGISLGFGTVSTAMALKIKGQNEEISRQSAKIEEQYLEARKVNAKLKAEEAFRLLEEGDRRLAVETAGSVLPNGTDPDMPYVAEAEYALSESLGVYRNGTSIVPAFLLKHESNVNFMMLSPDRSTLLSVDDANEIYLWDVAEGTLLARIDAYSDALFLNENQITFLDNERFACLRDEIRVFDKNGNELASSVPEGEGFELGIFGDGQGEYLFYVTEEEAAILDSRELTPLHTVSAGEGMEFTGQTVYHQEKDLLLLTSTAAEEDEKLPPAEVIGLHASSGQICMEIPLEYANVEKLRVEGDTLYLLNNSDYESLKNQDGTDSVLFYEAHGRVTACSAEDGQFLWQYDSDAEPIENISIGQSGDSDIILLSTGYDLVAVHGADGSYIGETGVGEAVTGMGVLSGSDRFVVYTRGGRLLTADAGTGTVNTMESVGLFQCNEDNIKKVLNGNEGRVLIQPYHSSAVTVMYAMEGAERELFLEGIYGEFLKTENTQGRFLALSAEGETLQCLDKQGQLLWSAEAKEAVTDAAFLGEKAEKTAVLEGNTVRIFDTGTGEELHAYTLDGSPYDIRLADNRLYQNDEESLTLYNTETGEKTAVMNVTEIWQHGDPMGVLPEEEYLAVASRESKELSLYEIGTGKKAASAGINTAFTETILCSSSDKEEEAAQVRIYVIYKNNRMECYLWDGGDTLVKERDYGELQDGPTELQGSGGQYELLKGVGASYVLREHEMVACIPDCVTADFTEGFVYTNAFSEDNIYRVPFYQCESLLLEARRQTDF